MVHIKPSAIGWVPSSRDEISMFLKDPTYPIQNEDLRALLKEVQQPGSTNNAPLSSLRELTNQYTLLREGIHSRKAELDQEEENAQTKAEKEIDKATGDDQRKLRVAEKARQDAFNLEYDRIRDLGKKLEKWYRDKIKSATFYYKTCSVESALEKGHYIAF